MWGRSPLCCMNRPPPTPLPCLMHAIFFALPRQEGGHTPAVARPRCRSVRVIAFTPSLPACQRSPGKHMDLLTTMVLKWGKRLHSNVAHGECRKERLILRLTIVWWCQILYNHSLWSLKPLRLYSSRKDDAAQYPKDSWILKDSVTHHFRPIPTFSASTEHSVPFLQHGR